MVISFPSSYRHMKYTIGSPDESSRALRAHTPISVDDSASLRPAPLRLAKSLGVEASVVAATKCDGGNNSNIRQENPAQSSPAKTLDTKAAINAISCYKANDLETVESTLKQVKAHQDGRPGLDKDAIPVLVYLGYIAYDSKDWMDSQFYLRKALHGHKNHPCLENDAVGSVMTWMAISYESLGHLKPAQELYFSTYEFS